MATLKILPLLLDIDLYRGATLDFTLVYNNLDPDTGEVTGQPALVTDEWDGAYTFKNGNTLLLTLVPGAGLTFGDDGSIRVLTTATQVAAFTADEVQMYLELTDADGVSSPVLAGTLTRSTDTL